MNPIEAVVREHTDDRTKGIASVCSAHPLVLRAAMRQALEDGSVLLVEATSNQVDQFGGYTGMTPVDFRGLVERFAEEEGLPLDRIVLGGDHLGPNRWQHDDPDLAMRNADDLVAAYAAAGYAKLHIDCSMRLEGDPMPLPDAIVAERAAQLIAVAEAHRPADAEPVYVIGTEVPVPGGAHETLGALQPTSPDAARATLRAHREALANQGLQTVWRRVVALVVQPAVEFDHLKVVDYVPSATLGLQRVLDDEPGMVFEAHSTDYQTTEHLTDLVHDHWAVLKVGPGLTFALREALFALAAIEDELVPVGERSDLVTFMDQRMLAEPGYWEHYYEGDADEQRIARRYSYSDRIRYYWAAPDVVERQERLFTNLRTHPIPEPLVSQYLPRQFALLREGVIDADPESLAIDAVRSVLRDYAAATGRRPQFAAAADVAAAAAPGPAAPAAAAPAATAATADTRI